MADNITIFQETHPSLASYWRSVILFGRNVASYKFALAKSLLEITPTGRTEITLEELADPFSRHLCEHIAHSPRQVTSPGSAFLEACRLYNDGTVTRDALLQSTVKNGFNNVIDAFHIVNNSALPVTFYTKDYSPSSRKIILTDEIFQLQDAAFSDNFIMEAEARWRLVETAWEQQISAGLLDIEYSDIGDILYIDTKKYRRKTVTSARAALNGYQKGKCFYCFDDISIGDTKKSAQMIRLNDPIFAADEPDHPRILIASENAPAYGTNTSSLCDVDHFFPYTLQRYMPEVNLNGIWNLVLTCSHCNRGENSKFAKVPALKYLNRLHSRNEFLIGSHHPLRETLMHQTGATTPDRILFLRKMDADALNYLIHRWETVLVGEATF